MAVADEASYDMYMGSAPFDRRYDPLELSESELDARIGTALVADEFGSQDLSISERREIAREWFVERLDELRAAVCSARVVDTYLQPASASERELFDAVLGALTYLTAVPVPLGLLAAKVLRHGLQRLCTDLAVEHPAE